MTSLIVVGAIALFVLITVFKGVRIVPQGEEWIVERLGRYHTTLKPGLNVVIPYMDVVAYRLPTKDIILDVQEQEIITRDNAVIVANALCFAKVIDPQKASYGVQNYAFAVTSLTMTSLRAIVGAMDLDEALSSREQIKARLREAMSEQTEDWGVTVRSVEIQDIKPSRTCNWPWSARRPPSGSARPTSPVPKAPSRRQYSKPKRACKPPGWMPRRRSAWPKLRRGPSRWSPKRSATKPSRPCTCSVSATLAPWKTWRAALTPRWWYCRPTCRKPYAA